jgi:hypothetical protein
MTFSHVFFFLQTYLVIYWWKKESYFFTPVLEDSSIRDLNVFEKLEHLKAAVGLVWRRHWACDFKAHSVNYPASRSSVNWGDSCEARTQCFPNWTPALTGCHCSAWISPGRNAYSLCLVHFKLVYSFPDGPGHSWFPPEPVLLHVLCCSHMLSA